MRKYRDIPLGRRLVYESKRSMKASGRICYVEFADTLKRTDYKDASDRIKN